MTVFDPANIIHHGSTVDNGSIITCSCDLNAPVLPARLFSTITALDI